MGLLKVIIVVHGSTYHRSRSHSEPPNPKGPNKIQECCGSHWSPKALPQNLECLLWHGAGAWRPEAKCHHKVPGPPKGGVAWTPKSSTGGGLWWVWGSGPAPEQLGQP